MGQATRTTKLPLDFSKRTHGGANTGKRAYLEATVQVLNTARAFYVDFFLAHQEKLSQRVPYFSQKHQEERKQLILADKLLTWAEFQTVETKDHPDPLPDWNFSQTFPDFPVIYRRSVIKDAIGKVKSYLSNRSKWQHTGKKKGRPGLPGASNSPTLYEGAVSLELSGVDVRESFVHLKVYTGQSWTWVNYPVKYSRYFEARRTDPQWEQQSPKLILRRKEASLHFSHTKEIRASKIIESKRNPVGQLLTPQEYSRYIVVAGFANYSIFGVIRNVVAGLSPAMINRRTIPRSAIWPFNKPNMKQPPIKS